MARDPQSKIDRILAAATVEFARAGPQGARIDAIALAAGVNKRMLYHYVGDKETLFDAVVEGCLARLREVGSEPDQLDSASWRILCHASVAPESPDLAAFRTALCRRGESTDAAEMRVARALLRSLLPDLSNPAPESTGLKPRVRVRPELRGVPDTG